MNKQNSGKRLFSNQTLSKLTFDKSNSPKQNIKSCNIKINYGQQAIMSLKEKFSVLIQGNNTRSKKLLNRICLPKLEIKQRKPNNNLENFQWSRKQISNRLKSIQKIPQFMIQQKRKTNSSAVKNVINSESIFGMQLKYSNLLKSRDKKQIDILDYRLIHDYGVLATKRKQCQQMDCMYEMVKKL